MTDKVRPDSATQDPKGRSPFQVSQELGVPFYLVKQAIQNLGDRITWDLGGKGGRKRIYGPAAVERIRRHIARLKTRRERATQEASSYWQGLAALHVKAGQLGVLSRDLHSLFRTLRRFPPSVTAYIHTLPDPSFSLVEPLGVVISPLWRTRWRASLAEAGLFGVGAGHEEALLALREEILRVYLALCKAPESNPVVWAVLEQLIHPRTTRGRKEALDEVNPDTGSSGGTGNPAGEGGQADPGGDVEGISTSISADPRLLDTLKQLVAEGVRRGGFFVVDLDELGLSLETVQAVAADAGVEVAAGRKAVFAPATGGTGFTEN